ncbi:MAG: glycoside hydrolase family 99-like domain-containing protein [Kiritimatiellae bacterium]|nr:glycoside hydrolase family 99-like domain-containing protein [Kiritimatiellia bacterium]
MKDHNNTEVFAIYFPSWHPDRHYAKWYGAGFSEWELVKTTKPLFPGHHQPRQPLWGFFDESDPVWMAKQIDLAADHGVTGFLFDWYWYSGEKFLEAALERGFLNAPNRQRLKFALMWANHSWGPWPAVTGRPGFANVQNQGQEMFLDNRHSPEDLERVVDYCAETYFREPNYWKIDGKPVYSFFDVSALVTQLGGEQQVAAAFQRMQQRAQRHGWPGLFLLANIGCCNDNEYCCGWNRVEGAGRMGFEAAFAYNIVRSPRYAAIDPAHPVYSYDEVMASHRHCWRKIAEGGLPHFPSVTRGLDVSPRWHRGVSFPLDFRALQYEPIVADNTPEKFGALCREALELARRQPPERRAIVINAWNEWTEGMFLLPEAEYGNKPLEALRAVL